MGHAKLAELSLERESRNKEALINRPCKDKKQAKSYLVK